MSRNFESAVAKLLIGIVITMLVLSSLAGIIVSALDVGYTFLDGFLSPSKVLEDAFKLKIDAVSDSLFPSISVFD